MDIILPKKIYAIYNFFEKTKSVQFNPFKDYKSDNFTYENITIKIAKNISDMNFYQVDFIINKKIQPSYVIQYISDPNLRTLYSDGAILYKQISKDNHKSVEEEHYNDNKNTFNCILSKFMFLTYVDIENESIFNSKYYASYKILNNNVDYVLRFETALNQLDIDQEIDLDRYIKMIGNIIKAIYHKFKIN
jgi:hypothetical protein